MSVSRPQPPTGWHTPIFWFCGCRGRSERVTYANDFDDKVAALEARLAEAETHRDKNRETAISSQQWVNQLEARCVQLEDNLRIAIKVGLDDQARIAELEAQLQSVAGTCTGEAGCKGYEHFDANFTSEARVRYCECGLPLDGHTHGTRPSQSETPDEQARLTGICIHSTNWMTCEHCRPPGETGTKP